MKRRISVVLVAVFAFMGIMGTASACPAGSLMLAGGAPGYPDVCFSLVYHQFFPW